MAAALARLGVIGGRFDPPHLGHLVIASEACARLGLERVLFVPAAAPPHKDSGGHTPPAARLKMTALAVADDMRFVASGLEIEHGLVYTRDTLAAVAERFPGASSSSSWVPTRSCSSTRGTIPTTSSQLCSLVVAPRPGDDAAPSGGREPLGLRARDAPRGAAPRRLVERHPRARRRRAARPLSRAGRRGALIAEHGLYAAS